MGQEKKAIHRKGLILILIFVIAFFGISILFTVLYWPSPFEQNRIIDDVMISEIKYTNSSAPLQDEQFIELKINKDIENGSFIQWSLSTYDKDGNYLLSGKLGQCLPTIRFLGKGWRIVIYGNSGLTERNETGKNVIIHLNLTSGYNWLDNSSGFIEIMVSYSDIIKTIDCVAFGNYTGVIDPIYSWPTSDGGISVLSPSDSLHCDVDLNNSSNWYSGAPSPGW